MVDPINSNHQQQQQQQQTQDEMEVIVNYWPISFRKLYGGYWPKNYICFDIETTSIFSTYDFIIQWGHCIVRDQRVVDRVSVLLDWSKEQNLFFQKCPNSNLDEFFKNVELQYRHRKCKIHPDRLKREGLPPLQGLNYIWSFLERHLKNNSIFVAHNGLKFDEKVLRSNLRFLLVPDFQFGPNQLIDTNAVEKASQLIHDERFHPLPNDNLRSYFKRVLNLHVDGVRSNLPKHCYNKYIKYALGDSCRRDFHDASFDAYCCHVLMEEWRKYIYEDVVKKPVFTKSLQDLPSPYLNDRKRGQRE